MILRIPLSKDFVELSVGKVYFKQITNGIVNKVTTKSIVANNIINNNLYLQLMEYELVNLYRWQIDRLPLTDGEIIREKLKEILIRHNLISEVKEEPVEVESENIFDKQEVQWFNDTKKQSIKKLGLKNGRT